MSDDGEGDGGGYKRPPKSFRFKPGQSGCPDGGHAKRRAKKKAKEEAEQKKQKQKAKDLIDIVRKLAHEEIRVKKNGDVSSMPRIEATLRKALDKALQPDATPRDANLALQLYKSAGLLDKPSTEPRPHVLVLYPPMEQDEWAKATEGELLPRNPLEGIPGAENALEGPQRRRMLEPPEDT